MRHPLPSHRAAAAVAAVAVAGVARAAPPARQPTSKQDPPHRPAKPPLRAARHDRRTPRHQRLGTVATPWRVCSPDSAARTRQRVLRALPETAVRYVASAVRLCSTAACTWVQARPPPPQFTRRADVRTCLRGCTRPYSCFTARPRASLRRRVDAACACAWRRVRLGGIAGDAGAGTLPHTPPRAHALCLGLAALF
eukprot:scaffold97589_cov108-Phaeocystis_antarctica.AAC.1